MHLQHLRFYFFNDKGSNTSARCVLPLLKDGKDEEVRIFQHIFIINLPNKGQN
jgi:hypothetical protein